MAGRLNYYFRQKVTESELDLGFTLLEDADHALMTDMAQIGVLSGMVVTQRGAGANLTVDVSAGKTYDKNGQRIQFATTQNVDVSVDDSAVSTAVAGAGNSKVISLFVKFARVLTDPRTDGNSTTVYFNEAEGFGFSVKQSTEAVTPTPVALDATNILLADITRTFGDTQILNAAIGTSRREDVFVHAGATYALRRGLVGDALADAFDHLNTNAANLTAHIANGVGAHAASAISYAGSGAWADATTVASNNVEAAIDEVVSDLAAAAGAARVGGSPTAGAYMFSTAGATVQALIDSIQSYLNLGPRGRYVLTYTASQALTTERQVLVNTSGGAVTLTLPTPAHGIEFFFKDKLGTWGTNNFTLAPHATEKIEGVNASRVFSADWGAVRCWSDGTDWYLD